MFPAGGPHLTGTSVLAGSIRLLRRRGKKVTDWLLKGDSFRP